MAVIVISGVAVLVSGAVIALAMARVAAQADAELDELLALRLGSDASSEMDDSYAGLARAQPAISREPSTTVPSSRRSVGTQRLPVSSWTSRLPRVWLNTPGSGANP
jgi:hypothetical protein